jgi:hypothetical protein
MQAPDHLSFSAFRAVANISRTLPTRVASGLRHVFGQASWPQLRRARAEDAIVADYACNAWCDSLENQLIERLGNPGTRHW